jgi:nitrate/TMAO reductase-like tetraheme cytochrome c subunit
LEVGDQETISMKSIRRSWKLALVIGIFAFIGIATVAGLQYTSSPSFCGEKCHQMSTRYASWKHSTHSDIECLECHAEPGIRGEVAAHVNGVRYIGPVLTGELTRPIIRAEVSDATCLQCHKEVAEALRELREVHTVHIEIDLQCTNCHANLVHATIQPGEALPTKETCVECHQQKGVFVPTLT